ncbi:hypothetical protein [Sinimarinibacterium flocculans]|uniref:hypothetical protein n=1 Tax=Sinimarinibacterium flocculans TaxID=985250 RepID=UPI0024930A30|nr:hypothetical protein [Sinimarinibacterium flocculans]
MTFRNKLAAGSAAIVATTPTWAQVGALDASAAATYLEDNAGGAMLLIGAAVLTLAGLGVAIKWTKATFFG